MKNTYLLLMKSLIALMLLIVCSSDLFSQNIVINEVQANNIKTYQGPFVHNPYIDWIELKNNTSSTINIGGYFLSDDPSDVEKWSFPSGTIIPPNGYFIVSAGGPDVSPVFTPIGAFGLNAEFSLSFSGETILLSAANGSLMDSLSYETLPNDISYGKLSDGSYSLMSNPTPESGNDDASAFVYLDTDISIGVPSGLYDNSQTVDITNSGLGQIYYTLDGTTPSISSTLYTAPIVIDTNTVLKVIAIVSSMEYSLVENRSYVIGASHDLPIILLTSDNSYLGSLNKEVINGRVEFNFIETDGSIAINQYANFEASGKTSDFMPQLNGKVKANDIYGDDDFDHKMYPDKNIDEFNSFLFRNASQDWGSTHLRDAFVSKLNGQDNLANTPFEAYRPAVLYVNAKYQGIINIREDDDNEYIKANFGLKNSEFERIPFSTYFISNPALDFNIPEDREAFAELANFNELLSLKLTKAFAEPGEWGWRVWEDLSGKTGYQYHYHFHDFDDIYGLDPNYYNNNFFNTNPMAVQSLLDEQIRDYEPFKHEAIHFVAASINHIYNTERAFEILDQMTAELASEIPAHAIAMTELANSTPWIDTPEEMPFADLATWNQNIADMKVNIANVVGDDIFTRIQDEYDLDDPIQITYESSDINQGFIKVHDVKSISETFTGTYFSNIPVRFSAEALPGYQFVSWSGDVTSTDISTTQTFSSDANIIANFEPISNTGDVLVINEVQGKNDTTIPDEFGEFDDWIEIYNPNSFAVNLANYYISDNLTEPLKWKIPNTADAKTTVAPNGFLLLWADNDIEQGENHIGFKLKGTDQVILTAPDAVTLVQQISYTDINTDLSYGAIVDADPQYVTFDTPTPNATNGDGMTLMELSMQVFLEGAMNESGTMSTDLSDAGLLIEHPYLNSPFDYTGPSLTGIIPANTVDFILIELRQGPGSNNLLIAQQVAFVLTNGDIVLEDGSLPRFTVNQASTYQIWLRHHNHLDVFSDEEVIPAAQVVKDFLHPDDVAGPEQLTPVGNDIYAMFSGDVNQDGTINVSDYNSWKIDPAIINVYTTSDMNLDGSVQTTDYDVWFENRAKIGFAQNH